VDEAAVRRLVMLISMSDDLPAQDAPVPEPQTPREPPEWVPLEEGRKGFAVMPTEPAEPINILDQMGGPPAPDVLDSTPGEPPSPGEPPAPPGDGSE
jgi:hypothetical protein